MTLSSPATIALASLPLMGPSRLGQLIRAYGPDEAWKRLTGGAALSVEASDEVIRTWRVHAASISPEVLVGAHERAGVRHAAIGEPDYPERLRDDPEPPAVLFWQGEPSALEQRSVGVVGTRRCTRYGRDVAFELGCVLGAAGVSVVSGLAMGIDAAAHAGVMESGGTAVGVVASGLDNVYPPANRHLWSEVARTGLIVTEHPLGVRSRRWMFPARNRIIAGLSDVVVVVESAEKGGSLYTVDAALERDRPVFAVPGPIRSPASAGTNRLLADGALPYCAPGDVLEALALVAKTGPSIHGSGGCAPSGPREGENQQDAPNANLNAMVLDALGWQPCSIDQLVAETKLRPEVIAAQMQFLVAAEKVVTRGGWFERTISR